MSISSSPALLFPPVGWWADLLQEQGVVFDDGEPFHKMTWRNRYRIATANGPLLLSVPVTGGRTLRAPMREVRIDHRQDWQKQHWRSLFSAYGRAPFFEHYGPQLERLLQRKTDFLIDFNSAALQWILKELRLPARFVSQVPEGESMGRRLREAFAEGEQTIVYTQVFEDRHGFLRGLSILDLLMNEGPAAAGLLAGRAD